MFTAEFGFLWLAVERVTPQNATILLRGAVTESLEPDSPWVEGEKNDPLMPLAWLREYQLPEGKSGQAFGTTAGASVDFESEDLRRLIVNAAYFLVGLEVPEHANVEPVDPFEPSFYGFHHEEGFFKDGNLRVSDFQLGGDK